MSLIVTRPLAPGTIRPDVSAVGLNGQGLHPPLRTKPTSHCHCNISQTSLRSPSTPQPLGPPINSLPPANNLSIISSPMMPKTDASAPIQAYHPPSHRVPSLFPKIFA